MFHRLDINLLEQITEKNLGIMDKSKSEQFKTHRKTQTHHPLCRHTEKSQEVPKPLF